MAYHFWLLVFGLHARTWIGRPTSGRPSSRSRQSFAKGELIRSNGTPGGPGQRGCVPTRVTFQNEVIRCSPQSTCTTGAPLLEARNVHAQAGVEVLDLERPAGGADHGPALAGGGPAQLLRD